MKSSGKTNGPIAKLYPVEINNLSEVTFSESLQPESTLRGNIN